MLPRPVPHNLRGRRRATPKPARPAAMLACPRRSPAWEFESLEVLMRPHDYRREAIAHRRAVAGEGEAAGLQPFAPADAARAVAVARDAAGRLGLPALGDDAVALPPAGDYHLVVAFALAADAADLARALAVAVSRAVPAAWFTLDAGPRRLFLLGGRFHRRERGYKLNLRPARDVHLPRGVRAKLRGLV